MVTFDSKRNIHGAVMNQRKVRSCCPVIQPTPFPTKPRGERWGIFAEVMQKPREEPGVACMEMLGKLASEQRDAGSGLGRRVAVNMIEQGLPFPGGVGAVPPETGTRWSNLNQSKSLSAQRKTGRNLVFQR